MNDTLTIALSGLSLLVAVVALVHVVLDRPTGGVLLGLLGLLEAGLLVQAVYGVVALVGEGHDDVNAAVFVGYLLGALLFVPAAAVWALGERSRAGTAVVVVLGLVVPVLLLRMSQVWDAGA